MFTQLGGLQLEREIRRIVFKLSTEFPEVPVEYFHVVSILFIF